MPFTLHCNTAVLSAIRQLVNLEPHGIMMYHVLDHCPLSRILYFADNNADVWQHFKLRSQAMGVPYCTVYLTGDLYHHD